MIPTFVLQLWICGLCSLSLAGFSVWLAHEWYQRCWIWDDAARMSVFSPNIGANLETALLAGAIMSLSWVLFGRLFVLAYLRATSRTLQKDERDPRVHPKPSSILRLTSADGAPLHVELYGSPAAMPIVFSHGWGLNADLWNFLKHELAQKFQVVVWDQPGLGRSARAPSRDYTVENLASNLRVVLGALGGRRAILVGHSIGGMITLTYLRDHQEESHSHVAGIVLTHTTPTNPIRTTSNAAFYSAIEKPILIPLLHLTIWLSPLVWLLSWLNYWNGTSHITVKQSSFGGTESWEHVSFAADFMPKSSPAVLARGMLGMMEYSVADSLPSIDLPTLVVEANLDTTTTPDASEWMKNSIPGAQILKLSPAKHLGLLEHHEAYIKAVREFAFAAMSKTS